MTTNLKVGQAVRNQFKGSMRNGRDNYGTPGRSLDGVSSDPSGYVAISPNFILQYDKGGDPFEVYETMREVEERIKMLAKDYGFNREAIRIYNVSSVTEVQLDTRIILGTKVNLANTKKTDIDSEAVKRAKKAAYQKKWYHKNKAKKSLTQVG